MKIIQPVAPDSEDSPITNLHLHNIPAIERTYNPSMVTLEKSYRAYGYNRVLSVGLPSFSGRYFVVLGERETLLLAELNVQEDGSHAWSHYQSGSSIPEASITMWKRIQF